MEGVWQPSYDVDVHMDAWLTTLRFLSLTKLLESAQNSGGTSLQQMIANCGDWGRGSNQDSFHINGKHIQGGWQPPYDVDAHMDVS